MRQSRDPECERHAEALLDFVAGQPSRPDTSLALRHLERCPACEREAASLALIVTGLRRLGAAGREIDPPADGWERVERRIAPPPPGQPGGWRALFRRWLAPLGAAASVPVLLTLLLTAPVVSSPRDAALTAGGVAAGSGAADVNVTIAASGPVVVGDDVAMGGGRAVVPGVVSELESGPATPAVTPGPGPAQETEPPQPALRPAPVRSAGVGPM